MNWKYRIATLLIMLAPGIAGISGAKAVGDGEDSVATFTTRKEPVKFKGYRIIANPAEYLLLNAALQEKIPEANNEDNSNDRHAEEESARRTEPRQLNQQVYALQDEQMCRSSIKCRTLLIMNY
ncbi:MAG: hypothetical protein P8100_15015 [bacterium]|jgi:hypothetical protein